jgi:molybdopterin-guanine dinucleotide biosynthesis protein A
MGRTKATIDIDGRMMADRVIDALREVGANPVVIYGGDTGQLGLLSAEVIPDEFPGAGPVGGVMGALRHFADSSDGVLVVACDLAMITARTLQRLIDAAVVGEAADVWVGTTDQMEPMCALWSTRAIPCLEREFAKGERALHRLIERCRRVEVPLEPDDLLNINSPTDIPNHPGR